MAGQGGCAFVQEFVAQFKCRSSGRKQAMVCWRPATAVSRKD
ncbi:hypothetical protein [Streptomyces maremycinicus]|nr:hypothetical protein [Streptomyces sp. NBRC 110468]